MRFPAIANYSAVKGVPSVSAVPGSRSDAAVDVHPRTGRLYLFGGVVRNGCTSRLSQYLMLPYSDNEIRRP